jgi:histidinol-phosphate phosphatase family protein
MKERAIFFDRDGTINVEKNFISSPDDLELIPSAAEALRLAVSQGFRLFVVSNQSGIAREIMTSDDVERVNLQLEHLLAAEGVSLGGIYYCPHHPSITGPCDCRKPGRGMIDQALAAYDLDLSKSFVVGDRKLDMELAFNIGARAVMVLTGWGRRESEVFSDEPEPDYIAEDILEAVNWIVNSG